MLIGAYRLHKSCRGLKISSTELLAKDSKGQTMQVPVTEEADVFEALGLEYRAPAQRERRGTHRELLLAIILYHFLSLCR